MMLIVLLIILIIVGALAYFFFLKKKSEHFNDSKLKICLFKATWCNHCKVFEQSNVFNDTYEGIKKDYPGVVFVTYDFDENKELASGYNVNSFPTIIAVDASGKFLSKFSGDRTSIPELTAFVKNNMQA